MLNFVLVSVVSLIIHNLTECNKEYEDNRSKVYTLLKLKSTNK